MEANTMAEMENISTWIWGLPGFCEIAVEIHLIVALQQAVEQESIEALRLRISGKTRIEIGGAGFDEESKRRRIVVR